MKKRNLLIFIVALLLAFFYWRLYVLLFYNSGNISLLRAITNFTIHHRHYGIILITIASIMFILDKINNISTLLMGFGLGTILDSFFSTLFPKIIEGRIGEIQNYNQAFISTLLLFSIIIIIISIFYIKENDTKTKP